MTAEAQIRELAKQHEVEQDEIDDLLVNLARAGHISGHRMLELLVAYMHDGEALEPTH